jgi:transcriptional regulator with XRE-family HTH domain
VRSENAHYNRGMSSSNTRLYFRTNTELAQNIGDRVRQLRLDRNWTQEKLANEAGMAVGALKNLEAGRDARLSTLIRALRAMSELEMLNQLFCPAELSPPQLMDLRHARQRARTK